MSPSRWVAVSFGLVVVSWVPTAKAAAPLVEEYLTSGRLADGEKALAARLKTHPDDDEARYGLGVLQFVRGIERTMQSFHQYGLLSKSGFAPILRLPVPKNPDPEPIGYDELRQVYAELLADVLKAEKTLAGVKSEKVKLRLHFGRIKLDFNGDGKAADDETLWKVYSRLNRNARVDAAAARRFAIAFDRADVHWLRGYCHLLAALNEFILAHDWRDAFERTGQLFFPKMDSPYSYLKIKEARGGFFGSSETEIADVIALIHMLRFECKEPKRMTAALGHLEAMIAQSRECFKRIKAETDDDAEWIPNPRQAGVIPGVKVTKAMLDAWGEFQDEAEAILAGKKLIPHWRVADGRGVNLRKVFTHPTKFDLVLWIQGTAARPYLQEGEKTKREFWERMMRTFGGNFFGFAVWWN